MRRIIIVPTSHIAEESLKKVESVVGKEKPDCIAIELDPARLMALKHGSSLPPVKEVGVGSFLLFWVMKKIQEWLGKRVGILPGSEMLRAVEIAKEKSIPVAFIDRNMMETLTGIKGISAWEKIRLLLLLFKGITLDAFFVGKRIDLSKLPPEEMIDEAMRFLEVELPGFYRVLVKERNEHMASRLLSLSGSYNRIVAVVGAGHAKGMRKLLA